ncbi:response regulator transcription factor [Amylibacter sp. SFDW26]|uniref:response regulator transcription factor n=1 Tax=Amylibacter sp. SFDW26 TaxID=2652722 RepID=UPI001261BE80|nr:response regulator transcription factor [Amylibacter sp. SFDW26]KAB7613860.1 response regulator transcription factor [Amylibacter sp. SFDW26]
MLTDQKLVTILDDVGEIREMLSKGLSEAGFATKSYGRALEFERDMRTISPDLCIIDLGLPDKDGLALVNKIALESGAAIIIISGRSMIQDKIAGLELGADDYITKPFELAEVIARVRALLRRSKDVEQVQKQIVHFSGWTADFDQHTLTDRSGDTQSLSFAEAQVLRLFLDAPNRLITREYILDNLGTTANDNFERAIDVRVSRLRTKLKDDSQNPKLIKTIYGAGYIFIGETS